MSRQVNVADPDSWDDEDKAWLAQRMDTVPAEHRHLLTPAAPQGQQLVTEGISPQLVRLTDFVKNAFPHRADEDPVDVVISELGGDEDDAASDDYDDWKVAELESEAGKRSGITGTPTGPEAKKKQPWINALRQWDREHPAL